MSFGVGLPVVSDPRESVVRVFQAELFKGLLVGLLSKVSYALLALRAKIVLVLSTLVEVLDVGRFLGSTVRTCLLGYHTLTYTEKMLLLRWCLENG